MVENGRKGLTPGEVSAVIITALTTPRPKTRYEAVEGKFANATLPSLLPRRTLDRLMGKQIGLLPKA